ncbi:MAG: hypothetical protein KGN84_22765 [Acidobacteriota bacterium]|nr:hypothetical protein [Acidobacteriota bacterium]
MRSLRGFGVFFAGLFSFSALQAAQLQTTQPIVSQFEDGAALEGGQKFVAGESGFFRFTAVNFKTADTGRIQLSGHAQVFDPRGTPIAPVDDLNIVTALSEEDKDWRPRFHFQFQLPAIAPPGTYRIHYEVTDEQLHQTASGDTVFPVEGPSVAPSDALVVRQIQFFRNADDEVPLNIIAYRPGDAIWIRFSITGYKHGEQNAIDVSYDVRVTDENGKQLFSQENAATEKSQAFYPQPWVPGSFSLKLQSDTSPGAYTVAITARDAVGNQNATDKAQFRVE